MSTREQTGPRSLRRAAPSVRRSLIGSGTFAGCLLLLGCGGGDSATGPLPEPTPPPAPISFAPVAGDWTGHVTEIHQDAEYDVEITLGEEALLGSAIGTVAYVNGLDCGGELKAMRPRDGSYVVEETITYGSGCVNGAQIRFTLEASDGTLKYEWYSPGGTLAATAVLTKS